MLKKIFYWIFKLKKWRLITPVPEAASNCVMIAAPHTSNWDFVYTISALDQLGVKPRFTIKKEFNKFPLNMIFNGMGALWIDRTARNVGTAKKSMTEIMAELFSNATKPLCMVVTVEGTRSRNTKWKTGFYYAALAANVPICLAYMDYDKRTCGVGSCFMPSGDIEKDMRTIMEFYEDKVGKHPEKFALDERYTS